MSRGAEPLIRYLWPQAGCVRFRAKRYNLICGMTPIRKATLQNAEQRPGSCHVPCPMSRSASPSVLDGSMAR
jgi:hypothetical protein